MTARNPSIDAPDAWMFLEWGHGVWGVREQQWNPSVSEMPKAIEGKYVTDAPVFQL